MKCAIENCRSQSRYPSVYCERCEEEMVAVWPERYDKSYQHKPVIIGLGYKMGHGKDTVADHLVSKYRFVKFPFASTLKDAVALIYGWDRDLLDNQEFKETVCPYWGVTPRSVLQKFGQSARDNVDQEIWIKATLKQIKDAKFKRVVIPDVRYQNEVFAIQNFDGAHGVCVHVDRGDYRKPVKDMSVHEHESETELDGFEGWDHVLDNRGSTDKLMDETNGLIHSILNSAKEACTRP